MTDLLQMMVLSLVALSCGLLGPFLVLRKMTMFANALSHTVLLGIAVAFLITGYLFSFSSLLIGAILAALMTALFTGGLVRFFDLQEDASIGLVFTALFALGVAVVTVYMKDVHLGIEAVMGNVDILQMSDVKLTLPLAFINLFSISIFYKQFQITSFDSNLAKTLGFKGGFFQFFLLFLVAITCIGAFRAVGVILVLAFLVGPFLTARLFCHRLSWLLVWTPFVGVFASISGVMISRFFLSYFDLALSTGGIVTVLLGLIYVVAKCIASVKLKACEKKLPS